MAKQIGKDHKLAKELWDSEIHEARILAGFIDDPKSVTEDQMDEWADGFDSWDLCDQVCSNLFDKTIYSKKKILQWTMDEREFMKRAGFVLIAAAAVHDKKAKDRTFIKYLSIIKKHSNDNRNFVRKAVNWTLRQVGKRNNALKAAAIKTAGNILAQDTDASRWIARDALRELRNK
jgi:3-methyladenine DNA glycosylase AlkD